MPIQQQSVCGIRESQQQGMCKFLIWVSCVHEPTHVHARNGYQEGAGRNHRSKVCITVSDWVKLCSWVNTCSCGYRSSQHLLSGSCYSEMKVCLSLGQGEFMRWFIFISVLEQLETCCQETTTARCFTGTRCVHKLTSCWCPNRSSWRPAVRKPQRQCVCEQFSRGQGVPMIWECFSLGQGVPMVWECFSLGQAMLVSWLSVDVGTGAAGTCCRGTTMARCLCGTWREKPIPVLTLPFHSSTPSSTSRPTRILPTAAGQNGVTCQVASGQESCRVGNCLWSFQFQMIAIVPKVTVQITIVSSY